MSHFPWHQCKDLKQKNIKNSELHTSSKPLDHMYSSINSYIMIEREEMIFFASKNTQIKYEQPTEMDLLEGWSWL